MDDKYPSSALGSHVTYKYVFLFSLIDGQKSPFEYTNPIPVFVELF